MVAAAHIGTKLSHGFGGLVITGSPNVTVNNIPVARVSDTVTCPTHGTQTITTGSSTVFANELPIARLGDMCSCLALLIPPVSPNVIIG